MKSENQIQELQLGLITVLALMFMVNYSTGEWSGFDNILAFIGIVIWGKWYSRHDEKDWFTVFLASSILSISITDLTYFFAQEIGWLRELPEKEIFFFLIILVLTSSLTFWKKNARAKQNKE